MTVTRPKTPTPAPIVARPWPVRQPPRGPRLGRLIRTTDAKQIGILYLATALTLFLIAGLIALLMRAELHLEHFDHGRDGADGLPAARRPAAGVTRGPPSGCARPRRVHRRCALVAAPVLVLRPSRGLHRRAALLRDHQRGDTGLQPQT